MITDPPVVQRHPDAASSLSPPRGAIERSILPAGLVLVALSWSIAWAGPEPIRWYIFFPLWFGYILTVDGLVLHRAGSSYLSRSPRPFLRIFVVSIPFWWIFEGFNLRLDNWTYHLPLDYPPAVYAILASIAFSTVAPAILETAALYRTLKWPRFNPQSMQRSLEPEVMTRASFVGVAMICLVLLFPRQAFPLAWISIFLVLDPINARYGRPSLIVLATSGRWSMISSLCCAGITCGIFWEMWNYWSMPKWSYDVPYVGFFKIFEMPILGYGGYLPFAFEIFALVSLASTWFPSLRGILLEEFPASER